MIRPMTSSVTTFSGCVANGHQTIHFVSSAPSKIPYGGFSPIRLQTRLTPRPPSPACPRQLIGRHCRYLRPRRFVRGGSCDQSAPRTSDHDRESSGPWLPVRLYCPVGSSLTMATSAPLWATPRIMDYSVGLRDQPASPRGSPIYSASPFTPCRRPYSGGPSKLHTTNASSLVVPSPHPYWLGGHSSHPSGTGGPCNEVAAFA